MPHSKEAREKRPNEIVAQIILMARRNKKDRYELAQKYLGLEELTAESDGEEKKVEKTTDASLKSHRT